MSLRWKLALSLAVVGALVATALGATAFLLTRNRLYGEVDRSLEQNITLIVRGPDRDGRPGGRPDERGERINLLDVYAVQRIDASGAIVAGSGLAYLPVDGRDRMIAASERGEQTRTAETEGTHIRIRTEGVAGGAILIGRDLAPTQRVLTNLAWWLLVLVVATTVGAAAVGWIIAWRMTRPLVRLTGAAEHVAATEELDATVPEAGRDEVGRLAGAFRNMLQALQLSRTAQRRLVQDASHELKTPLTSIRTNTAVLRKYPELDADERDRILADLDLEVEELVALVDELVEAALEGRSDEPPVEVDLGELITRVATRVERRTGHPITVEVDSSMVLGQGPQLERAVSNLLENAAKFDTGSVPITCTMVSGRIIVSDHGPGIPDADKPRVFERFYRADAARSAPGSGLGLSMVREIARAHGGDVFVGDAPAGGTTIGFTIPVVSAP
jgi:two-component system sensor histidine kinase MprB